jgi:hypothetical protein
MWGTLEPTGSRNGSNARAFVVPDSAIWGACSNPLRVRLRTSNQWGRAGRRLGGPVFCVCGRRGVWASQPSRRWSAAQHGMGACGTCSISGGPRATFSRLCRFRGLILFRARGSCRSRVLRGKGARGSCFASSGPRGDLLTPMSLRGLNLSRARGSLHSRVLRGKGARGACFASSGPRGDLLTPMSLRGLNLPRARGSLRSRVLLVLQGTGSLNALR